MARNSMGGKPTAKPQRAPKPPKHPCGDLHPDGDTRCSRDKGHKGKHSGPFGEGMSLMWADGSAPRVADENCAATYQGLRCIKEAGHPDAHFARTDDGEAEWSDGMSDQAKLNTSVDGAEAEVVLDGKTGAPKQLDLIPKDPSEILGRLRAKHILLTAQTQELELRESAYGEQKKIVNKTQKEHNAIVAELCDATKDGEVLRSTTDEEEDDGPPRVSDAGLERIVREVQSAATGGETTPVGAGVGVHDSSGAE